MFTDFFFFFIIEADRYRQRRRVGGIPFLAFLDGILHIFLAQLEIDKFKAQRTAVVRNGRDVVKSFLQALTQKPLIGILLDFKEIRHLQNLFLSCITHTHNLGAGCRTYSVFFH